MKLAGAVELPPLLPGRIMELPGRGEMFVRHHEHPNPNAPTLLLLHGWTASSDLNFFAAYETLARDYSIVGVDHRGHGRGLRPNRTFTLEDCADDAAAVVRALGVTSVITVGYSMGGPISLLVWQRHKELVSAMVLQATAIEWNGTRAERNKWRMIHTVGPVLRRLSTPRVLRYGLRRVIPRGHEVSRYVPWLIGEMRRSDQFMIGEAGRAIEHFNATPYAHTIEVPISYVFTTQDQLVLPNKQQDLVNALGATVVVLDGDHLASMTQPREYASATSRAVKIVVDQL